MKVFLKASKQMSPYIQNPLCACLLRSGAYIKMIMQLYSRVLGKRESQQFMLLDSSAIQGMQEMLMWNNSDDVQSHVYRS